ncbi:MAG: beta-ketoacyl-ACP synthase II [Gammaproteobacteria bacterium]|nr:beta-ketoacyl-ACP synthase II [Gammaproteobacteria bacterium]
MRVVVTGMGIVSPIGIGTDNFWKAAIAGVSGIRRIESFDASQQRSQIAGQVAGFDPAAHLSAKCIEQTDRFAQLALVAANQAVNDAGGLGVYAPHRLAVSLGSGMGGYGTFESSAARYFQNKSHPPLTVPKAMSNAASAWIAIEHQCKGPNLTFSTACSSGGHGIGTGLQLLRTGQADAVIAGGAEACVLPLTMAGFNALHALSIAYNDDPARASRPFSKGRDGFVMAEGAGILVLEREEEAKRRGAPIYAVLAGYGSSCDATHVVAPDLEGQTAAMRAAVADAALERDAIDYINAHATSTPLGDVIETRAIKHFFGSHAQDIAISATKSLIGHTIGAAAAIGSIATIMTLRSGMIHPTINFEEADAECDLDYTPNKARECKVRVGLSNAFGFGGNNVSLLFTTIE